MRNRREYCPLCRWLAASGMDTVTIDKRGENNSLNRYFSKIEKISDPCSR
jgi:hypothetical protein